MNEENEVVQDVESLPEKDVEAEVAELKDQLLRALAETENVRRRAAREREDAQKYAISSFAKDILSVADALHRALSHVEGQEEAQMKTFVEGIQMTERELLSTFERHGVKRVGQKGEAFNHAIHQAMFEVPTDEHPQGTVVELVQEGYVLHERLLRPALVGVAKASS